MNRAYSLIDIKSVDEEQRVIEGIASTPTPDRVDDIVEPLGASFDLPLPFLWQHDSASPVGHVVRAKPTKEGIPVRIEMVRTDQPGKLKDLLDFAWESIKLKLVRGLSIGFKPIEAEPIKGSYGFRIKKWNWLELSAVTIPANQEATILTVKQHDTRTAATGRVVRITPPSALGTTTKTKVQGGTMTITERIGAFEASRAAKAARMSEIIEKCEGRTKDESEQEEFDTLRDEIKSVDRELVDLREMEKLNLAIAKPVQTETSSKAATQSREIRVVNVEKKLPPGIEFARYGMCLFAANGDHAKAASIAKREYPDNTRIHKVLDWQAGAGQSLEYVMKASVAGGTTSDSTWASPLVNFQDFAGDFVEFLRPATVIGRFGAGGIPSLRPIPFNVRIAGQTAGGTGYWVGEGKPKPITKFDYELTELAWFKVAVIAVLTEDLIRFSNPSAEALVRDSLRDLLVAKLDADFLDPTAAAVANVQPASVTNGVAGIPASGTTAAAFQTDLVDLWEPIQDANLPLGSAVYITTPSIALALSLMLTSLGQQQYPGVTMTGGTLLGVPLIVSNHVPGGLFILVIASEIWLADDGQVTVDMSREASVQMLDNPTNDVTTPTATTMVSLWQTNSVGLRAERFINWQKRRTTAVQYIHGAAYGGAES